MVCSQCGQPAADGTGFCSSCGAAIAPANPAANVASPAPPTPTPLPFPTTSGKSVASLIFGCFFFLFPSAVLAIILGHLSLSEIGKSAGRIKGRGMAITGLVLGYLGISFIPLVIIAAVAIPNLLRARIAANESSAVASVRTLNNAEDSYAIAHPGTGYTCSLSDLRQLIDSNLVGGEKSGYIFEIDGCVADPAKGSIFKYQIAAHPEQTNQTGVRAFCTDESAVIRVDTGGSGQKCLEDGAVLQ
jgi:type IV pilus assembly protein PilA